MLFFVFKSICFHQSNQSNKQILSIHGEPSISNNLRVVVVVNVNNIMNGSPLTYSQ
jgi:hypothetical protein